MEPLKLRDIINWIVDNSNDEEAMSKIAITAYPFSSKFKNRYPDRKAEVKDDEFPLDVHI